MTFRTFNGGVRPVSTNPPSEAEQKLIDEKYRIRRDELIAKGLCTCCEKPKIFCTCDEDYF